MKLETPKERWKALEGKGYKKRDSTGTISKPMAVPVQENAKCLRLPDDPDKKNPYGIPVDADLAIALISDFHQLLKEPFREKFISGKDITASDINFSNHKMTESFIKSVNELVDILKRSCAITIEKNVLLKTLSQPDCEGLRFYICKKSVNSVNKPYLSLVTVGVDKDGKDHLYSYPKSKNGNALAENIETTSLISEYGHPPGSGELKDKSLNKVYTEKSYVLLNYALDETKKVKK